MSVLDLVSALGRVDFDDFRTVFQTIYPQADDFALWRMRRDLVGLGHIHTDHVSRKIFVTRPRLCLLPPDGNAGCRALLIGLRNKHVLDELLNLPAYLGASASCEKNADYPERVLLSGQHDRLFRLANEFRTVKLSIGDDPSIPDAWRLLQGIENLGQKVRRHLSNRQPASGGDGFDTWSVFDPQSCRFVSWEQSRHNYPYGLMLIRRSLYSHWIARQNAGGTWEFWQDNFSGDPLWAKWAVVQSGLNPEGWLPQVASGSFRIPARLPLPLELHRVCCLCTGLVPLEVEGWLEYRGVPPVIQYGVRKMLSVCNFTNQPNS